MVKEGLIRVIMLGLNNPCFHLAPNRASAPMDATLAVQGGASQIIHSTALCRAHLAALSQGTGRGQAWGEQGLPGQ